MRAQDRRAIATPETPQAEGANLQVPLDVRSAALTIIAFLSLVIFLRYAQGVVIPIVLGVLISYALEPPVAALCRIRIPRAVAAALVIVAVVGLGGYMVYQLRGQAEALASELPEAARRFRRVMEDSQRDGKPSPIEQVQQAATEIEKAADAAAKPPPTPPGVQRVLIQPPPISIGQYVMWGSYGIAGAVGQFTLILFLTFFLLASGDLYRRKLVKIVPSLSKKKVTIKILEDISRRIEQFLAIQVLTSVLVGLASWLAFRWSGLEQAGVWGLLAGVFNSIPYFGPVVVTGSVAVAAFVQFGALAPTITVAGLALIITTVEGMLLTPWLTSRAGQMNAAAVFIGLLFWGWVWNIWGVLLAVPILMAIKAICDHVEDFNAIGELLGE